MVVRSQVSLLNLEVNSTDRANLLLNTKFPQNALPFQITRIPPEAPTEGRNSKESKSGGQKFLIKLISKLYFLVSCWHSISLLLFTILSLMEFHFLSEFRPLTFQFSTFHALVCDMGNSKRFYSSQVGSKTFYPESTDQNSGERQKEVKKDRGNKTSKD